MDSIKVEPSLSEEQFSDTNEEQLLAPFAFVAVNSQVTVSNIFVLMNDLVHTMLYLHQSAWSTEDIDKEYSPPPLLIHSDGGEVRGFVLWS